MAVNPVVADTGATILADTGKLSYNGITWSALYKSDCTGRVVPDDAHRTTKLLEWVISAEGVVTLKPGEVNTDATWAKLRKTLSVHGAPLLYSGNGFGTLSVNQPTGLQDVKWGPVPEVIFFHPYGQGRSAQIKWRVTTRIPELPSQTPNALQAAGGLPKAAGPVQGIVAGAPPVLQYSYGIEITYDDDGYSGLTVKGVLEIPLTRSGVNNHKLTQTVDNFRLAYLNIQIDLTKFKVVRRHFSMSSDKRTYDWEFVAEELPPMGLPENTSTARGSMSVRDISKSQKGFAMGIRWAVTLRCTYTVRSDKTRRWAAWHFYSLLWFRMRQGNQLLPNLQNNGNLPQQNIAFLVAKAAQQAAAAVPNSNVFLADFRIDEGLYLDSKQTTFEASWILLSTFSEIIAASGMWRWAPKKVGPPGTIPTGIGGTDWAISMKDIMGWRSWLVNQVDPAADLIVDLGVDGSPLSKPVK